MPCALPLLESLELLDIGGAPFRDPAVPGHSPDREVSPMISPRAVACFPGTAIATHRSAVLCEVRSAHGVGSSTCQNLQPRAVPVGARPPAGCRDRRPASTERLTRSPRRA